MIHKIANFVFFFLCHQESARCWAPGSKVLAFCQRCTGVYAGAAMIIMLIPLIKFKPNKKILWTHGFFMIQMLVFGFHLIPHSATMRTLSGQLFITGAFYFLYYNLQNRWNLFQDNFPCRYYFCGIIINLLLLPLFVRAPLSFASTFIELLGLIGILTIIILAIITIFELFTFNVSKQLR